MEVRLLAKRSVASSSAVLFFSGFSLYGAMLLMPLYYQDVRGTTALAAGVMLVPQGVGAVLSRTVAGSNIDKFGSRRIALRASPSSPPRPCRSPSPGRTPASGCSPCGWSSAGSASAAVTMPVMVAGYIGLDKQQIPHSSVLTRTAQQIGGSFGTAVLAVILEGAIAAHHGRWPARSTSAFWWSAGFSAVAVLLSLWLPGAQRPPSAVASPAPQPALVADGD